MGSCSVWHNCFKGVGSFALYFHCPTIFLVEMPLLLSAVAGVLVMHQSLGSAALDSLAAIGVMDAKLGVPLLLAILFYSNIFTRNDIISHNMLVSFP
jgi:hypothetical protein